MDLCSLCQSTERLFTSANSVKKRRISFMRKIDVLKVICIVLILLILTVFYYYMAYQDLTISHYKINLNVKEPIRIVHLSDLHNIKFGENNDELIDIVKEQEPDLIFMSGDMLNREDSNEEVVIELITALKEIAPVYFGYGNHEYSWERTFKKSLEDDLEDAGAIVVDNNYIDLEFKGSELRIGGYMGYYKQPHMFTDNQDTIDRERAFAEDFENTNRIKLLINHIPTGWLDWHGIDKYPVDVVFSGHYHGGMIRIPLIERGVFAPYVGWFPPYTKGMFVGEKATCILSAGLGSEHWVPRINNPPEIVVVDLVPEK